MTEPRSEQGARTEQGVDADPAAGAEDARPILGIGRPSVEMLGTVARLPSRGESADLRQFSIQGSGSVATALVALLEWGHRCRLAGQTSDDVFGALVRDSFAFEGFETRGLVTAAGYLSPFSFVALEETERMERTVIQTPGNVPPLAADEVDPALLDGCAALLIDGTEVEAQLTMAETARARGLPVLFDASCYGERQAELLAASDVLIASERFTAEVAPRAELEDSLVALQQQGPGLVIITMGVEGAIGRRDGATVRQPIFHGITPRERGGTGPLFFAGVVHALLQGWSLERQLRFASAAAGLACREIGSRGGIPSLEEVVTTAWPEGTS